MSPPAAETADSEIGGTVGAAPKLIGTHDGAFHCDEALAVHLLRQTATYRGAAVLRTRDPEQLATADVVVDVGGVYDKTTQRFDHHQRGFTEKFSSKHTATRLSSAGLVYRHFGREVLSSYEATRDLPATSIETLYLRIYNGFIEAVDAIDNGVSQVDGTPRYTCSTDLSARVGHLNAPWNAPPDSPRANQDNNFAAAVALTGAEFDAAVARAATQWLPARSIVEKAWLARGADYASGEILVMRDWAPWKGHLFDLEEESSVDKVASVDDQSNTDVNTKGMNPVLYVVYEDITGKSWRVQCVPESTQSFVSRRPLPEPWRGIRDSALSELLGIADCVFVHAAGFIGGNKTFEGAMSMALKALNTVPQKKIDVTA